MNEQKNLIPSAKLISHVLIDFSSEAEMELFINYVEKTGSNFYESMKKIGLMRFRLNQVWNKEGGFALSTLFEYKDENAYVKGQKVIEKHFIPSGAKKIAADKALSINYEDFLLMLRFSWCLFIKAK